MNLGELFIRTVHMYPNRVALVSGHGTTLTYKELDQQIGSLASWLKYSFNLNHGDRVILAMKNCPQYFKIMLACWRAGLCVVPVNCKLHVNEILIMAEDSGAKVCMAHATLSTSLRQNASASEHLQLVDVEGAEFAQSFDQPPLALVSKNEQDIGWLFFTSGTTGRPKGVMLTHANLVAMAMGFCHDLQYVCPGDVLVHVAPFSHGSGLYSIPYWIKGGTQVIPASGGFDEAELFNILNTAQRASLFAAPTIVRRMVRHVEQTSTTFTGLQCLFVGGAPFYIEDIKEAVRCFGARVAQLYGQGESPMTVSCTPADLLAAAVASNDTDLLGSVGFVVTSMQVEIRRNDGTVLADSELGEVTVSGPTVMKGYWNNPNATAATIKDGALFTGDIGLRDHRGLLYLKDRSKDVIISGGTNIYPREVEEVLLSHPAVKEVAVIGVPEPEWGESVIAFVVTQQGLNVTKEELDELCLRSIARFKRPKRYIVTADLPKNATGKILKSELQQQFAAHYSIA